MSWPSVARLSGGLLDYHYVSNCGVTVSLKANGTNVGVGCDGTLYGRRCPLQTTDCYQKVSLENVKAVKIDGIATILKEKFGVDEFVVYGEFIVKDIPKNDGFKKGGFYVFGIICTGNPKVVPGFNVIWTPERTGTFIIGMNPLLEQTLRGLCTCVPSTDHINLEDALKVYEGVFDTNEGLVITFKIGKRTRTEISENLPPSNKFFQIFKHTTAGVPKDLKILRKIQPRTPLIQDIIDLFTSVSPDISRSIRMEVASAESKYDCDQDIGTIIREVAEAREEERRCFIQ